jgi:hypothetical protein
MATWGISTVTAKNRGTAQSPTPGVVGNSRLARSPKSNKFWRSREYHGQSLASIRVISLRSCSRTLLNSHARSWFRHSLLSVSCGWILPALISDGVHSWLWKSVDKQSSSRVRQEWQPGFLRAVRIDLALTALASSFSTSGN